MASASIKEDLEIYKEMERTAARINDLRTQGLQGYPQELELLSRLKDLQEAEVEILKQEVDLRGETRKILSLENK